MNTTFDYIIVGLGIAGISICERLAAAGKSFVVIDKPGRNSTFVAGGVVNPTVLKRFTLAWKGDEFTKQANIFYTSLSKKLEEKLTTKIPIHRIFFDIQEQNEWAIALDKPSLRPFLSSSIIENTNPNINAPNGFGEVKKTFRVDTGKLLKTYREYLRKKNTYVEEHFNHSDLQFDDFRIVYKGLSANKIIFAEGASVKNNPFFTLNKNILIPKKGEYIIIKAPELNLKAILKGPLFIIPLGNGLYKVGATFAHNDTTSDITIKGKEELKQSLKKIINNPFQIINQVAGIRPTVRDRRPLLGSILDKKIVFFNGLGTRGLLMAPLLSKYLYDYMENGIDIPAEIHINRFVS